MIVLGARYGTYSPLPTAVFSDCETPVAETKLQGLWELDRIDNYEAFHEALGENSGFLGFIEVYLLIHLFWSAVNFIVSSSAVRI